MENTNESGRSMVEMLGVLAIIGVLSIGCIAGYTMAMVKYQANEIVTAITRAAVECRTGHGNQAIKKIVEESGIAWIDSTTSADSLQCINSDTGEVKFSLCPNNNNANVLKYVQKALSANLNASGNFVPHS